MNTSSSITKAFQWDLARQVERIDFLLKWLPRYAEWGYQELYLHLEDAVDYPSLPAVARSDAYSHAQIARLVEAATAAGIRVVPIVNLLGHTQYLIKVPGLRDLNELRDSSDRPLTHGQICPLHPRTLEIAEQLLHDMAPFCTAGKVHVGLDESFHLGRCPRCRAEIARVGLAGHFAAHVSRLHERTSALGLRLGLWADMLALLPEAIPQLPRDVIAYDWYYYPFIRHPRVELHNFAEVDLATPLQKQGIEYWGCPMNGAFRYEPLPIFGERMGNIRSWWRRCQRVGAGGFLITSWEANRLAIELTTAVDAAAACLWLDPEVDDPREMLARGFARVFGGSSAGVPPAFESSRRDAGATKDAGSRRTRDGLASAAAPCQHWARAALACDEYAFAGYHRWQINDRWDVCAAREPLAAYKRQAHTLERLCRSLLAGDSGRGRLPLDMLGSLSLSKRLGALSLSNGQAGSYRISPPALAASIAFRRYLAQRDVFVRRAARAVFQLRRLSSADLRPAPHGNSRRSQTGATLAGLRREAAAFALALRAGRRAARAMWNRSRDPNTRGPNELMLARDAGRLREWRRWLGQVTRNRDLIWQATPVCGAWQLQFTIHNFAPALQKVVVEKQLPNGSWLAVHGLYTIEFRAFAARPRARIRREISVPIDDPRASLRLAVRGVGQVAISRVELTDGVTRHHARGWSPSRRKILGRPAPRRGFPAVDFEKNARTVTVAFAGRR